MTVQTFKSEVVRQNWRDKLDDVFRGAAIIIERYTKPIAVLISYDEYRRLKGAEIQELNRISTEMDDGQYVTMEEARDGLGD
ncbi:type II toxin-antitoxin system Phd/YefM family antitoxin [Chloroflexi bacterium TSY]|nr:type II toxin-antitoxin system Phd/YefM family antitoxin [Chloroflexi bacterium TSY]